MENVKLEVGSTIAYMFLVVFVVLKLAGTITWSWWWVLSPMWITLAVSVIVLSIVRIIEDYSK